MKMLQFLLLFCTNPIATGNRLGQQSGSQKSIEQTTKFPSREEFLHKHIIPGTPLLLKGVARQFPAFKKWTDEYIQSLEESKSFEVLAEQGKKENRNGNAKHMTLFEFIKVYKNDDIYLVNALPKFLSKDIPIYDSINCQFMLNNLMKDNVMWWSSGGTTSVWHNDGYENINCLMRGTKELILANKTETKEKVYIDMNEGAYSSVDVDNVDVKKYPNLKDVQFYNITMEAGDCLYIPWLWFHYVKSFGSNLAVNVWWETYRSDMECNEYNTTFLDSVNFSSPEYYTNDPNKDEPIESEIHQMMYMHPSMYQNTTMDTTVFLQVVRELFDNKNSDHGDGDILKLFYKLDENRDGKLEYKEIDAIRTVLPEFLSRPNRQEL